MTTRKFTASGRPGTLRETLPGFANDREYIGWEYIAGEDGYAIR
jgi:hypothetical protein